MLNCYQILGEKTTIINQISLRLKALLQRLYPFVCALCGTSSDTKLDLCTACRADLPLLGVACLRCAQPLSAVDSKICGTCQQQAPLQDRTLSAYRYGPPLDHLILQLKFHDKLYLAPLLGKLTAQYLIQRAHPLPECIIPVPLHSNRLRERGFNQALEIAKPIATQLKIPINHQIIYRKHNTAPQSGLSQQERKRNMRDAFTLHKPLTARHVAIMDDVLTTGHTVAEIAKILRHAGAQIIEVWVCARTLSL